ncbi:hypothetical protein NA57DRAFT_58254 [Rhizodiscina lignyota]|uniref:Uncharacterized protein n=1 Tax=Rhizodiscina lignyota TaxID=1504668 RepID=A0A9P4ICB3_9PEZI|nr:hypothetical protein NA57DRAFT_58254 [Rhizodiscina lignyota]
MSGDSNANSSVSGAEIRSLLQSFEEQFPQKWHNDKWYLAAIGALIGCNKAALCGDLYSYLLEKPEYATPEQRKALMRRMREAMVKCIIINGIPVVMTAVLEAWRPDEAHETRALDMLNFLYQDDFQKIMDRFHAHRDVEWISTNISYGFFLSDLSTLSMLETELVVMPAILCQNLPGPTLWHLRCCVRVGISREDVEKMHQCIEAIAKFANRPVDQVGRVKDVQDDMARL